MKLALLATLVAFGGSLAGFGLTSGSSEPPARDVAAPAEHVIVGAGDGDRDCPKARGADRA